LPDLGPINYSVSPIDTTEVIEVQSQAVLHNFTEHDLQDEFKKKKVEVLGKVHMCGKGLLRG
jgi:hypothetical protein